MQLNEWKDKLGDIEEEIKRQVAERLSQYDLTLSIVVAVSVAIITTLVILFLGVWKLRKKVLPSQSGAPKKYRFRKRDKVLFYGRKMLRKVSSFSQHTLNAAKTMERKGRRSINMNKKEMVVLANRFSKMIRMKKDPSLPMLQVKTPPKSFFEADGASFEEGDHRIPSEVLYMLRSVRVFGHFEKPLFLELCKHMETKLVPAGSYLFRIGDEDNSIYVVQSGKINVYISEQGTGSEFLVKEVGTGDTIHSLLSVLDYFTGNNESYKTVSARAMMDSTILKLPATALLSIFERFPESLVRVVQVIMVRLQRVTFTALHNYLGLSSELINKHGEYDRATDHSHPRKHSILSTLSEESEAERIETPVKTPADGGSQAAAGDRVDGDKPITDFDTARMQAGVIQQEEATTGQSPPQSQRFRMKRHSDPRVKTLEMAKKDLASLLKLKNEQLLEGRVQLNTYKGGTSIIKQGDHDTSLIFVVSGRLSVLQTHVGEATKEVKLFSALAGEIVGDLAVLTGEPSFYHVKSKIETQIVSISKDNFYAIMTEQPSVVLSIAATTLSRLTPFVRQIDFALDWMMIESGRALFRQGDHSDCVYIVLTGRLRSVNTSPDGKKEMVGEYGRGELVGIVEVLTQQERVSTAMAIRDTELAKIPSELLNLIKRKHPQVVTRLIHLLGQRIIGSMRRKDSLHLPSGPGLAATDSRGSIANLATIAILPASKDIPLTNFTLELQNAIKDIGTVTRITVDIVKKCLGAGALDSVNEFRLFSWLGVQEDTHRMILYQCDYTMTRWTKMCIRQADCILIVGLGTNDPKVGELEQQLETIDIRAQKELVLLHHEDAKHPRGTVEWLNARGWCSSHHHIRCHNRVFKKYTSERTAQLYDELFKMKADRMADISRLARFLTGTSIGLILGGGGARGLSHVGIIRAMLDARIPIDMVGGTSIGSFIGAVWCEDANYDCLVRRSKQFSMDMASLARKVWDLTYPVASMFTGGSFNDDIEKIFKNRQIEDLWIPYFCITTDITASEMRVHTHGCLWRYVRASMSLAGYLPPLCDPRDGHLLLDGGYINNLPADVIRSFGAQSIFAVDVGSVDNTELTNYGDKLSGWWLLWKRYNPWASSVRVPDMQEIQSRLAYVSCMRQLETVKNSDYCEYIRPPIDKYGTLQFGSFDEIAEVGYNHGKTLLMGWEKGGLISKLFHEKKREGVKSQSGPDKETPRVPHLSYFTDLAELVSKIDEPSTSSAMELDEGHSSDASHEDVFQAGGHVDFSNDIDIEEADFYGNSDDGADDAPNDDDDDDQYVTDSEGEDEEREGLGLNLHHMHGLEGIRGHDSCLVITILYNSYLRLGAVALILPSMVKVSFTTSVDPDQTTHYALPRRLSGYLRKK